MTDYPLVKVHRGFVSGDPLTFQLEEK